MDEKLLKLLTEELIKPLNIDEIYKLLELKTPEEFMLLSKELNNLEEKYLITHNRKGEFASLKFFNLFVGTLDVKDGGFGFVDSINSNDGTNGVFIPSANMKNAVSGDVVLVKLGNDSRGRIEGNIERIIKRANPFIYGKLEFYHGRYFVYSIDSKIKLKVDIEKNNLNNSKKGDFVKVKINQYFPGLLASGTVEKVLGNSSTKGVDITSLIYSSNVKTDFSDEAMLELNDISDMVKSIDTVGRIDLTNKQIITIDGLDAKDLDDAISVELLENGNYMLGVYIADVSNYVNEGTFLDLDASLRGTSIYLPDRVIPMLPKKLSNGICSLNEGVIRLVMACEMEIDEKGNLVSSKIFEAFIKSKHRMTYDEVNSIFAGNEAIINKYQDIYAMIQNAKNLSYILKSKRQKAGAFFFEDNEEKLIMDENGHVKDIVLYMRQDAEKMIEEFMLAANECVAETMTWLDVPFIYRVHEAPNQEKLSNLLLLINSFGYNYKINNKKSTHRVLQQILKDNNEEALDIDDSEKTKRRIINETLIKSMAKAKYQDNNIGHFGLASKCYTHFTSPIRRYPDLLVHRLIKQFLLGKEMVKDVNPISFFSSKVSEAGITSSNKERIAERLERDAIKYKKCEYMESFIGDKFYGTISLITPFGVYIVLDNSVEGIAKFAEMHDDYYNVLDNNTKIVGERTKMTYFLGDRVRVRLLDSDKAIRQVNFRLIGKAK